MPLPNCATCDSSETPCIGDAEGARASPPRIADERSNFIAPPEAGAGALRSLDGNGAAIAGVGGALGGALFGCDVFAANAKGGGAPKLAGAGEGRVVDGAVFTSGDTSGGRGAGLTSGCGAPENNFANWSAGSLVCESGRSAGGVFGRIFPIDDSERALGGGVAGGGVAGFEVGVFAVESGGVAGVALGESAGEAVGDGTVVNSKTLPGPDAYVFTAGAGDGGVGATIGVLAVASGVGAGSVLGSSNTGAGGGGVTGAGGGGGCGAGGGTITGGVETWGAGRGAGGGGGGGGSGGGEGGGAKAASVRNASSTSAWSHPPSAINMAERSASLIPDARWSRMNASISSVIMNAIIKQDDGRGECSCTLDRRKQVRGGGWGRT